MTLIDIIGHLSFVIVALSFLMRDIVWLRTLSIFSGLVGITYNFFIPVGPLWIPITWLSIFILINIYMIVSFFLSNRQTGFTEDDIYIWKQNFWGLSAEEFRSVRKIMKSELFSPGGTIIKQGQETKKIFFIASGTLAVDIDGQTITTLTKGDIAGEMSFLSETSANANVKAVDQARCIAIEKVKLRNTMVRSPSFHLAITSLFNKNLLKKIAM